jgi:hypothetical protein
VKQYQQGSSSSSHRQGQGQSGQNSNKNTQDLSQAALLIKMISESKPSDEQSLAALHHTILQQQVSSYAVPSVAYHQNSQEVEDSKCQLFREWDDWVKYHLTPTFRSMTSSSSSSSSSSPSSPSHPHRISNDKMMRMSPLKLPSIHSPVTASRRSNLMNSATTSASSSKNSGEIGEMEITSNKESSSAEVVVQKLKTTKLLPNRNNDDSDDG